MRKLWSAAVAGCFLLESGIPALSAEESVLVSKRGMGVW